jgi:4-amino-4-deoxy-L-arabinose transferase-like glycosyltransferase
MKISLPKPLFKKTGLLEFIKEHQNWFMIGFVVLLALAFRIWQIGDLPAGINQSEVDVINKLSVLNKNRLWLGGDFTEGAYLYLALIWIKVFGFKVIILRVFSAVLGTLTVFLSYLFVSKWFSQKIAIFTAFLLAISSFHITLSRLIVPEIFLPVILLLVFTVLTEAYRSKCIWLFGISGFLVGFGLYSSPAFLFVPIIFLVSGIYFFLKNKKFFLAYKYELGIAALGFLSIIMPFLIAFIQSPISYLTHFGFNRSGMQILINIGQIPNLLFLGTPPSFFLNVGTEPLLDPFIFIASVAGFLYALFKIGRRKYFFMITWLVFFSIYAALKRGVQIIDLVGILPVLYAFAALILDFVIDLWFKTFPVNKNARVLIVGLIAIFFALSALYNFDRYFVAYKYSKEVKKEFSATSPIPLK